MAEQFHFSYGKAASAVATLLRGEPGRRMNYYRLLKLLYIADRESVAEVGRPILGGRLIAMDRGPLHSAGFNLVAGRSDVDDWWSQYFRTDHYELVMEDDPGNSELSRREIDLLNRVRTQYEEDDEWALGKKTHDFPEFLKNQAPSGKSRTIPFADLLSAVGRDADVQEIMKDAREKSVFDNLFGV